jgi:esterase/lipase
MTGCLIIHGYTGGPYEVEPLATYLDEQTDWDIVVPTLPGHGEMLALKNVAHETWLKAAEDSLQKLKEKYNKVYLIGFSMGGMIAAYLAAKFKVDKLVLLATAGKLFSLKQITLDIGEVITDRMKGTLQENKNYVRYKKKLGKVTMKSNIEFLKLVKYTRGYLKNIESPVFIAHGIQDGLVPARTASYLDKEITTSSQKEVVLFERSDHLICWGEDKDTLNGMVYNFLQS